MPVAGEASRFFKTGLTEPVEKIKKFAADMEHLPALIRYYRHGT